MFKKDNKTRKTKKNKAEIEKKDIKVKAKKAGLAPGTLEYTGARGDQPIIISMINYLGDNFEEKTVSHIEDIFSVKDTENISWIYIDGVQNAELIEKLGKNFDIHPLVLEDIMHTSQRPKLEDYTKQIFIVLRMFDFDNERQEFKNEQVSFVLGKNYLISFLEDIGDAFEPVRERLRKGGAKLRNSGADYLAYALIDAIVDSYFHLLEKVGEDIEDLEDRLVVSPNKEDLQKVHQLRRDLILLRKSVWPLREVINSMQRNESGMIQKTTEVYLRDVYDHTIQVIETIESYREMVIGMLDIYLSSISNKMNEVMKVLTIISTVFIPLTFLAGVYGMNFDNFPELRKAWMYPWGFWCITCLAIVSMVWFFRKRKWI